MPTRTNWSSHYEDIDLWQLPPERQTEHLSRQIERAFYARCRPDQRPSFIQKPVSSSASDADSSSEDKKVEISEKDTPIGSEMDVEALRNEKAPTIDSVKPPISADAGTNKPDAVEKKYDGSLLMALNATFFWRWWQARA